MFKFQPMFEFRHWGMALSVAAILTIGLAMAPVPVRAASAEAIDTEVDAALANLYRQVPAAKQLASKAKAILVFPAIVKGGLIVGGQYGEGALRKGGRKSTAYYSIAAASYGLQAGVQRFGYALFFMTNSALEYLDKTDGWEVGVGPSVVLLDEGLAKSITTTTAQDHIYAFVFGQEGLMAGMGVQGSKITRLQTDR